MQEPMRVIALSALVLPLGFIAQVADQHHAPSSGEYTKHPWGRRLADAVGSRERSRPDQNEGAPLIIREALLDTASHVSDWIGGTAGLLLSARSFRSAPQIYGLIHTWEEPHCGMRGGASGAARLDYVQGASEVTTRGEALEA